MPVNSAFEFFGETESEHNFAQELYTDTKIAKILEDAGFTRDSVANRRTLFISPEIGEQLAGLPDDHPFKQLLAESGAGSVIHRGGDTSVGGFQQGKNNFQRRTIDRLVARSELLPGEAGYITKDGLNAALQDLHKFGDDLATGKIVGPDGKPVGVLGTDPAVFERAYESRVGAFDPEVFNDPNSAEARNIRASLDAYRSSIGLDGNGSGADIVSNTQAKFRSIDEMSKLARERGFITAEQFNNIQETLGRARTDGAVVRNASIMLYRDVSAGTGAYIGSDSRYQIRALAEGRAVAQVDRKATVGALADQVAIDRGASRARGCKQKVFTC